MTGRSTWCERSFGTSTSYNWEQRPCAADTGLLEAKAALKFVLSCLEKEGGQLAKRFYDALTLRIRQRRSEAAAVLQTLHNNLLPQDEEESEIFSQASRKDVDQSISRMLLWMSGEGIGDAVTESEGEEVVEQPAAEPTL